MTGEKVKVKNFDILHFVADNAWLSTSEAIEKAYNAGVSEQKTVLDKIRTEINGMYRVILRDTPKDDWAVKWNDCLDEVLKIIDKYRSESEEHNHMTTDEFAELFTERDKE